MGTWTAAGLIAGYILLGLAVVALAMNSRIWKNRYRSLEERYKICLAEKPQIIVKNRPLNQMHRRGLYSKDEAG